LILPLTSDKAHFMRLVAVNGFHTTVLRI